MTSPAAQAAEIIKSRNITGVETALILSRSMAAAAEIVEDPTGIPYADLPGFPGAVVKGGEVQICSIEGVKILLLKGRPDFHETGDPSLLFSAIETLSLLGVRNVLAAGFATSVNAQMSPSSLVAIADHIDFKGLNPLIGAPGDRKLLNMNEVYDKRLLRRLRASAASAGVGLQEGVYLWHSGPSFETPAEAKLARLLGADVMGMALASEAILARRFNLPYAAVVVVTDFAAGFQGGAPVGDLSRGPTVAGVIALRRLLRAYPRFR
ncbi:MAG TPA: purine-nucleoside phosphorylase [Methylocystis sp.]|nr:purine-nucleoside phosphorylase [Methylocystis sp.]